MNQNNKNSLDSFKKDCENLKNSSLYIKNWIQSQSAVKEESITDWLLFDISKKIPRIKYKAFSRIEEARKTGADWEWWFLFPEFSFKMRIQAKKLTPNFDHYSSLIYTNQYGLQIDKLLNDSLQDDFMPLYAFYTAEKCSVMCRNQINEEGVYLAGGHTVYNEFILNGKKQIKTSDIIKFTNALSCIFCCPMQSKEGFVEYFQKYYNSEFTSQNKQNDNLKNKIPGYDTKIPSYITSFVEHFKEGLPDWWEKEFHHAVSNIKALVVYDVRE